jgi:hypothetical protein
MDGSRLRIHQRRRIQVPTIHRTSAFGRRHHVDWLDMDAREPEMACSSFISFERLYSANDTNRCPKTSTRKPWKSCASFTEPMSTTNQALPPKTTTKSIQCLSTSENTIRSGPNSLSRHRRGADGEQSFRSRHIAAVYILRYSTISSSRPLE